MGNENDIENKENEYENNNLKWNIKAPEFYINQYYPNHRNHTLKEIINDYIEVQTNNKFF